MFSKLKNIIILSKRQQKFILLVFWLSIYRNLLLLVKSKKAYSEHICKYKDKEVVLTSEKIAIAKDITMAISIVNKYILWKNVCRHQSWQAVYLLLLYGISFEFFVGIKKHTPKTEGHSWVKVNGRFICGKCNENDYYII